MPLQSEGLPPLASHIRLKLNCASEDFAKSCVMTFGIDNKESCVELKVIHP